MRPALALAAAFVFAGMPHPGGSRVSAQGEPAASFEGLAEVKEVLLDVIALDREGRRVPGLGPEDFLVEENGKAIAVTGVSYYTTRYSDPAGEGIPASRYLIFFFHDRVAGGSIGGYLARQQIKARTACLAWIEDEMRPSDWVAVASYDLQLKLHRDFTQDRLALAQAIKDATSRKNPERRAGRRGRAEPPVGQPSLLRHLPKGKALNRGTRTPYDGLRLLAEAAGYTVGRKNLVLFSPGFGELDLVGLSSNFDPKRYPPMEQALNDHNIAVYPIDLAPVDVRHLQGRGMTRLALATGGLHFKDATNFKAPLARISEENVGYYLLSYQSEHPAETAGYQEVEVKARDPEIRLRARRGYRFGTETGEAP